MFCNRYRWFKVSDLVVFLILVGLFTKIIFKTMNHENILLVDQYCLFLLFTLPPIKSLLLEQNMKQINLISCHCSLDYETLLTRIHHGCHKFLFFFASELYKELSWDELFLTENCCPCNFTKSKHFQQVIVVSYILLLRRATSLEG